MSDSLNTQSNSDKFLPPKVYKVSLRQHLYTMLDAARKKLLIIVQGQAAQGKSTLVASYLNQPSYQGDALWLHLSVQESHHTNLFNLLARALFKRLFLTYSSDEIERLNLFQSTPGTCEEDLYRQIDTLFGYFFALSSHLTVVLDNYEKLDNHASSFLLLQKMIDKFIEHNIPIQLIIISRRSVSLDISMLKLGNACLVLKNEDLAFTLDETHNFFRRRNIFQLSSKTVEKIQTVTDGWVGGVVLIAEYLERGGVICSFPHHLTAETVDYFTNEVYSLLPYHIQQLLIRASLFDEINEDVLEELCDTGKLCDCIPAGEVLDYLETHNLFIQRMTGQDNKVFYRFNTLFRTYLLKELAERLPCHELKRLKIKAAQLFEQRDEKELSVRYYLDGESYDKAADMIKKSAVDLIVKGECVTLQKWIELLPDSTVQKDPWLICYLAITWRIKGGKRNIQNLLKALSIFNDHGNIRGSMLCIAYLIEGGVFIRKSSEKIAGWIAYGEELLSQLCDSPLFSWTRAVLWQQISFGYIAGGLDIQKGLSACKNARLLSKKIGDIEIEINSSIIMAFGYVKSGNCSEAAKELKMVNKLIDQSIHPEFFVLNQLIQIDLELKKGDFKAAEKLLSRSEADVERFGLIFLYPNFIELKAFHSIFTEKFDEALHLCAHLADFSILSGNRFYLALSCNIKAMLYYHTGSSDVGKISDKHKKNSDFALAEINSEKALKLFHENRGENGYLHMAKLLHGIILIHLQNLQLAHKQLTQAIEYFTKRSSYMELCETRAALGLLCWTQHQYTCAQKHILTALTRAVDQGYRRFNFMAPSDFVKVLVLGICFDRSEKLFNFFAPLIAKFSYHGSNQISQLLFHPFIAENISHSSNLKRLYRDILPRVTITTLGGFSVLLNNRKISEKAWGGHKPKVLLKAIICNNSKDICREKLIEDIWPECSADVGEKNFKVTLHRLRNALESGVHKNMGYCYITLSGGGSLLLLNWYLWILMSSAIFWTRAIVILPRIKKRRHSLFLKKLLCCIMEIFCPKSLLSPGLVPDVKF